MIDREWTTVEANLVNAAAAAIRLHMGETMELHALVSAIRAVCGRAGNREYLRQILHALERRAAEEDRVGR